MVKLILGAKGAGKTKWLINGANDDIKSGNGNITFLDVEDEHIFSLDTNVRLINLSDYSINTIEKFYGFLLGMLSMDFDLEKIYIDSVYKIIDIKKEDLKCLVKNLEEISEKHDVDILINVDYLAEDVDSDLRSYVEEVK
ncbi:hypothetical protein C3V37_01225 [Peptostreptococcaceae bacterium oral taxon 929]|uniref:Twitching motility protein PilT n=1 Tax=Fenollaria massiliensis TaxID=938288 RepID=A0A9E7DKR7_9FIRM|nr:hypothetical protein [Fenollaria massiliensis]AVM66554.1 hypothetical protein C3V37_01225 [Peptostreptococcaceae bacterium oral taxon 929]OFK80883.1 hypothetical protein HMPREF2800_01360 [Anaerosphaera sp. HMSC064C01]UQK59790.1 hypothetical protein M1R53_03860 [Fenollaria massiliensis]